jgi:hypothetical protein
VGDFGGYHVGDIGGLSVDGKLFTYLFGPKIALRLSNAKRCSGAPRGLCHPAGIRIGCKLFRDGYSGGVDLNAADHIGVRLIQADYLLTRFGIVYSSDTQNNLGISAGVVFRF